MPESSRWLNAGFALLAAGLLGFLIYLALLVLKVVKP